MEKSWFALLPMGIGRMAKELTERAAWERCLGRVIYPAQEDTLKALEMTSPEQVKVVIVGQVILRV